MINIEEHGFITKWLVSGPKEEPFTAGFAETNQLSFEKKLRGITADEKDLIIGEDIRLGENSPLNLPWRYYNSGGNWFVDASRFYPLTTKVEMLAAVYIHSNRPITIPATLWSYAAIDLRMDEKLICRISAPVYKPIIKMDVKLKLARGMNFLNLRMQNLGVRDTRNQFALQLNQQTDDIQLILPDSDRAERYLCLDRWLRGLSIENGKLRSPSPAPCNAYIQADSQRHPVQAAQEVGLNPQWRTIEVCGVIGTETLKRKMDIMENIRPVYLEKSSQKANDAEVLKRIAEVEKEHRMDDVYFSIFNILARADDNGIQKEDNSLLLETLDLIESRIDCADFLLTGLIRLIKLYHLDDDIEKRLREVLLTFRYWMDEEGADGMCFWSENHALMFYSAALFAGELYPEAVFTRSGKTGEQLSITARRRCHQWLEDIERDGFEEFNSSGYMLITFCALLNLIDFCEPPVSTRAADLADLLLEQLALHSFRHAVIGPQGRVYRDVIYPHSQGVQALINMMDRRAPYHYESWMAMTASTKYVFPPHLKELMNAPVDRSYETGNATIRLKKTADYILSSVVSVNDTDNKRRWEHISLTEIPDDSYAIVKSLNERFHGTTHFRPGVYGYQQHMWSGALDCDCLFFVNHPGGTYDGSCMRPGYWYGNGVMPALEQRGSRLGAIYSIPEEYPIHFTHLFWPESKFHISLKKGPWLFGKKGNGYVALWCSAPLVKHNDQLVDCEYRCYERESAFFVRCSSREGAGSFDRFMEDCMESAPVFRKDAQILSMDSDFHLTFSKAEDETQYI